MYTRSIHTYLSNESSKSPYVVTAKVDLDIINPLDLVKVRFTDEDGNAERFWMQLTTIDKKSTGTRFSGYPIHDLIILQFPKHALIHADSGQVVDHLPYNIVKLMSSS